MADMDTTVSTDQGYSASQVVAPADPVEHGRTNHLPEPAAEAPKADAAKEEAQKAPAPEKLSSRDAVAKAIDDTRAKAEGAAKDAASKVDAKEHEEATTQKAAQRAPDGKFAKPETPEATQEQVQAKQPAPEKSKYAEPPSRFLPEARTKWANVPNEIKAEMHRVEQEREQEVAQYKQSHDRYETIRQFDELARTNGRDLRQSLEKVVQVERALAANPIAGLEMIMREMGPRKPDGSPLSLYEIAQHIVQSGPQAYQQTLSRAMQQMQPQQMRQQPQQQNSEVAALRQEIMSMKVEQSVTPVVTRFASQHPDFEQLAPAIKIILDSGTIDAMYGQGLSLEQKLAEAYRMAGGSPSIQQAPAVQQQSADPTPRLVDPDGRKSVAGAPGVTQAQTRRTFKSNREALEALMPR